MSRTAICYCHHVSHVLNLNDIPSLMTERGWRVRWFNAFPAASFPLPLDPRIEYVFDAPQQSVGAQSADLYLSPLVGQSANFPRNAVRVHFLVSLTSIEGVYDKAMFDHYDVIACAGRHHIDEFSQLGRERGWRGKTLLPLGYPKLDLQRRQLAAAGQHRVSDALTVVFAPTHAYYVNQNFSVLREYGERIVQTLIDEGIRVIFRPHIESWRDQDRPITEGIAAHFKGHPLFSLDRSGNYFESYAQSDLMLTDISGTGFTYAFTFGRPALFFAPNLEDEHGKSGIQFERRENIGLVIRKLDELPTKLRLVRNHMEFIAKQISEYRDWLLFNLGRSESYFADHASLLTDGRQAIDWVKL